MHLSYVAIFTMGAALSSAHPSFWKHVKEDLSHPIKSVEHWIDPKKSTKAAPELSPDLSKAKHSTFVPFVQGTTGMQDKPPMLHLKFGKMKEAVPVIMDTGSTGITLSYADMKSFVPDLKAPKHYKKGHSFLSSSGLIRQGVWVTIDVEFADAKKTKGRVPVLAVTSVGRCPAWNEATASCPTPITNVKPMPKGIRYCGVGFGPAGTGAEQIGPDKNVLLHMTHIGGHKVDGEDDSYAQGYVVSKNGIKVGLTAKDTQNVAWQKLKRQSAEKMDWAKAVAHVRLENPSGRKPPAGYAVKAILLVDTGIPQMYLTLPSDYPGGVKTHKITNASNKAARTNDLKKGSRIEMDMGDAGNWSFVQGDANDPTVPQGVYTMMSPTKAPWINTGRHFVAKHDVVYDAKHGFYGVRAAHT